ncbi:MAG: hypothetical protein H0X30_18680 [Anaerolineae bacterium]|nr:hypothetical protein [Anaerolineae bacterium]
MQVTCPNCGEKVTADNINIQKMTAVCAACDTVFSFELPEIQKAKRRKVKQPATLTLRDDQTLQMEFWTNFRLDRNGEFLSSAMAGLAMSLITVLLIGSQDAPPILVAAFLLIALSLFYRMALTVVNKTHLEMDEDTIKITRKPIPNPLNQGYEVPLAGVTAIKYEETAISKKEAFDTPRYQVWAETVDGNRRNIVNDVTEDYAVFIAQRLQERLQMDDEKDVSRLEDDQYHQDDDTDMHEVVTASKSTARS